ncbi:circadian-associated transcriptional repressor [Falco naumanni]|uniref:circadian-associated transcriptional repressor n=1 Tax=Falco naumanni TaxID=148594 RepID=UPI001ADE3DFD|nr:circadian-associated transcriptional repressor [Falco naumanni]
MEGRDGGPTLLANQRRAASALGSAAGCAGQRGREGGPGRRVSAPCRGSTSNGSAGGRGPAGGTCGRARVRVGPPQPGRDRDGSGGTGTGTGTGTAVGIPAPGHRYRDTDTGTGTPAPGHRYWKRGTGPGTPAPGHRPRHRDTSPRTPALEQGHRYRCGNRGSGPGTLIPAPGYRHSIGTGTGTPIPAPGRGHRHRRSCSREQCQELRGFIQPLAELLEGLKRGRYDRGLSSFQQSVAMDRLQRIIGVLQKPEMGARYLGTLLQVEGMLRLWFPHVAPKPPPAPAPAPAAPRRRPPAGPHGAPRCRRLPGDTPVSSPTGTAQLGGHPRCHRPTAQTGTPPAPEA